jgi:hypothetical protein
MKKKRKFHKAKFIGRKRGAIGKFYPITVHAFGESKKDVEDSIREKYEPLSPIVIK